MQRVEEYIVGNQSVITNSFRAIESGIRGSQFEHGDKLEQINEKIDQRQAEKECKAEQEQKRKADRRLAREKRAKDEAKAAFRD